MAQPPRPGPDASPAPESGGGQQGGLRGLIRRAVLRAVSPELRDFEARLEESSRHVARLIERTKAVERGLGGLVGKVGEVAELADARLTQLEKVVGEAEGRLAELAGRADGSGPASELGSLREAFLATHAEFEALRDQRIPGIERRLDEVFDRGVGALQREMEALRDVRVPAVERRLDAMASAGLAALQDEVEHLRDERIPRLESTADSTHAAIDAIQVEIAETRDTRVAAVESAVGRLQDAVTALQESLGDVRDARLPGLAGDVESVQQEMIAVQRLAEEVRDERLPGLSARVDALLGRLHEELTATVGLVDRILAGEPLRVRAEVAGSEEELPAAFRDTSSAFMDTFRGASDEIAGRVKEYLPLLEGLSPVLDLGCGRGELLGALAEAGIEATGIDDDPAMVDACRRNGLAVSRAELVSHLRALTPGSVGAITAVHVLEHLPAAVWMNAIDAAAVALRSGGLLVVECPNPEALRVGAALFWVDPTHHTPLHPDSVAFVVRAVGLEVVEVRYRRPFPADQCLAADGQSPEIRRLAEQLDAWLSGPRDFAVIARKP